MPTTADIPPLSSQAQNSALAGAIEAAVCRSIGSGVYYPVPVHLQPAYAARGGREGQLPIAERASRSALSLPLFPELPDADHARVCNTVREFFR